MMRSVLVTRRGAGGAVVSVKVSHGLQIANRQIGKSQISKSQIGKSANRKSRTTHYANIL
jgi:hypothetical protein